MTPLVLLCNCFTDTEDSATLGSDTSAVSGLREAVHVYCLFLLLPLESQSDKPTLERLIVCYCNYNWLT